MGSIPERNYAHPEVLVDTDWVSDHKDDPGVSIVEVNVDTSLYEEGHVEGAIGWSWKTQLSDRIRRDILTKDALENLLGSSGITPDTTVVLYGDSNNWFAAWAFWQLKVYGHADVRIMDGGRKKWIAEGRPLTKETLPVSPVSYQASEANPELRALLPEVMERVQRGEVDLVDVRSPQEFSGEVLAPPGLPETCQRGGHIPGASNIPWSMAVNDDDGTFRSRDELAETYGLRGISGDKPIIAYCRIGERSSHSWMVLRYLLGYDDVKNYDGSWTEWGNLVGAPVETGPPSAPA
ncbi:MAG: sulfurtransferase [Gemmatimonadetes bacterium]|nr:sulfurtransferase [Gemmatimonadota bacterium]